MLQRIKLGLNMKQDYVDLSEQAYEMRTHEIQRMNNRLSHDLWVTAGRMGSNLLRVLHGISELLRPLFSWNPQPPRSHMR